MSACFLFSNYQCQGASRVSTAPPLCVSDPETSLDGCSLAKVRQCLCRNVSTYCTWSGSVLAVPDHDEDDEDDDDDDGGGGMLIRRMEDMMMSELWV